MVHSDSAAAEPRSTVDKSAWIALVVLTGIYACHSLDRAIISLVVEPMKRELALSDSQVGVIAGLGYGIMYAVAALPVGALIDRYNRVRLLATLSILWSGMTALAGLGHSFLALLLARMGVGAAEAGGQPAALAILYSKFAEDRRASALGIFYLGSSIGYAASFFGGGLITQELGWRAAFFLAGVPGIILGLLLLALVRDTVTTASPHEQQAPPLSMREALRTIMKSRPLCHLYAAMMLAAFAVTVTLGWMVPLMMRGHGLTIAQAGLAAGVTMGGSQAIGALVSGALADRLNRGGKHRGALVAAVALAATFPLGVGFILMPRVEIAIACLITFGLFTSAWTAPGYNAMLGLIEPRSHGRALALMQILATLCGSALAPFVVGVISDFIGGPRSLVYAMAMLTPISLWSALHFVLSSRAMARSA